MESHVVNFVENVTEWQCDYSTANPSALRVEGRLREAWKWAESDPLTVDKPHCPLAEQPRNKTPAFWVQLMFQNLGKGKMVLHLVTHSIYIWK